MVHVMEGNITGARLLERARALQPLIQSHRMEGDAAVRVSAPVHEALAASGIYRASAPIDAGGLEVDLADQARVIEQLGYADVTVAWCVANSAMSGLLAARMDASDRRRLYERPDAFYGFGLAAGGRAVAVDGGYRVSGRWPVVSGAALATWFGLGCIVHDAEETPRTADGAPEVRFLLVDAVDVEVLDTWSEMGGMRGTGSHAVRTEQAWVPRGLAVSLDDEPQVPGSLFRLGIGLVGNVGLTAAMLGGARAAFDALVELASARVSEAMGVAWRDWPTTQERVAACRARIMAARAGLFEVAEAVQAAVDGAEAPPERRADVFAMVDLAQDACRQVCSELMSVASITGARRGHPLELTVRDVQTMSVNWARYRQLHFDAGRTYLGLAPTHRFF